MPQLRSLRFKLTAVVLVTTLVALLMLLGSMVVHDVLSTRGRSGQSAGVAGQLLVALAVALPALLAAFWTLRRFEHVITRPVSEILVQADVRAQQLQHTNRELAEAAAQRVLAQQEIMRLNQELELRVQERTRQLELANGELALAMQEACSANAAKSAFLSAMSHELRTPLNAILGFAQILSSDRLPSTLEQKKEFAGHILKSGRHLLTLINEILDLAKVEAGAVNLSLEAVPLQEVIDECRDMIAPLAAGRAIRLAFPLACPWSVTADRTRLRQILLNLLSNALKYNREQGQITLDCSRQDDGRLRISVCDTGLGLDSAQQALLFQPFNRLGQESGKEEGSGIGLVLTRRLVELMDGQIGVHSIAGQGSTFWVDLPLAQSGPVVAVAATPAISASATLLYVEDHAANLALVKELIAHCPQVRLLTARDGESGVALARSERPDIIVLDINLPGMDGAAVLALLRADARTALTANAMARDIERSMALGFYRYLSRPLELDSFCEAINSTLDYLAQQSAPKEAP
ncbi:ATP-binding protein [Janthinobacterium aquaticum]|uniref:ATP-binding protein n=1 Tax=Janthinobacterium sp. FT58W TaxID=2654254 RepID=UPI0012657018|nr:ATP-binding protein [Janthinobacterium sp. FT58W]KAB8043825.1 response regulator [Janthinobacterium sp. FT58W]